MISLLAIELLVKWHNYFYVCSPHPCPQLGVRQRPLLLDFVQLLKLGIKTFEPVLELLSTMLV